MKVCALMCGHVLCYLIFVRKIAQGVFPSKIRSNHSTRKYILKNKCVIYYVLTRFVFNQLSVQVWVAIFRWLPNTRLLEIGPQQVMVKVKMAGCCGKWRKVAECLIPFKIEANWKIALLCHIIHTNYLKIGYSIGWSSMMYLTLLNSYL